MEPRNWNLRVRWILTAYSSLNAHAVIFRRAKYTTPSCHRRPQIPMHTETAFQPTGKWKNYSSLFHLLQRIVAVSLHDQTSSI